MAKSGGPGQEPCGGGACGLPRSDEELRRLLSPEQYRIVRQNGTELPFANAFWDHKEPGLYVDVVSGEPLFGSFDKFDSGTGWPSFKAPLEPGNVVTREDRSQGMVRIEVRSRGADSHLGHLFPDGPGPAGRRYCINSAALRFVPVDELGKEGYGRYLALFGRTPPAESSGPESRPAASRPARAVATFGAGCFWGVEAAFREVPGVLDAAVGYMGGTVASPTYHQVCMGTTGHAEVVHLAYDPALVSYERLLEIFFRSHDPTTLDRQGPDVGTQYRSAIFFHSPEQERAAWAARRAVDETGLLGRKVVTEIVPAGPFWRAEEYHQRYLEKRGPGVTPTNRK